VEKVAADGSSSTSLATFAMDSADVHFVLFQILLNALTDFLKLDQRSWIVIINVYGHDVALKSSLLVPEKKKNSYMF
jgi:hypothetical protein